MKKLNKNDSFYVLRNPINHKIKIGRTDHFKRRKRVIITQSGIPEIETLFHFEKNGDYEKYFKKIFTKYNHVGEWYHEDSHLIWLFTNTLFDYEYYQLNFEEIVIRFSILENELSATKEFKDLLIYSDIKKLTEPLYLSARSIYNQIKAERKGLGWGVQKTFLDFITDKNIEFRNFNYKIITENKSNYWLQRVPNFDISNPQKHIQIEMLKMELNNEQNKLGKMRIQKHIDELYGN